MQIKKLTDSLGFRRRSRSVGAAWSPARDVGFRRWIRNLLRSRGIIAAQPAWLHEELEPAHVRRFFDFFEIDFVLDIGANAGQYATMLREKVGYEGTIVSCEPNPALAAQLRRISEDDADWFIEECAVSDKSGEAILNVMANNEFSSLSTASSVEADRFRTYTEITQRIVVAVTTVADLLPRYIRDLRSKRVYVKIDVQGTEHLVIQGARAVFSQIMGFQIELSFKQIYENSLSFNQMIEEMQKNGFELVTLFPNNAGHFPTLMEMDGIFYNKSYTRLADGAHVRLI